jgi:eukaryotic-like serine/threonine-protein kinase
VLKPYKRAEMQFCEIREIGHDGNNSSVSVVHDYQLDAEIVIKKIKKSDISNPAEFFEESKKLYRSRHPNVVDIHYACEDNDFIYIAMPFYENGSIKNLINKRFLTVREIIKFSIEFLQGLHNIHSKKLIHFDVKPDNILLSKNNEAMISDFGQAKPVNLIGLAGQDRLYNKQRPPEAFSTDHFDLKYDIYQVGITLYRMCNGDKCFYDQFNLYTDSSGTINDRSKFKFDVVNERFPSRDIFLPHIPEKMKRIVKKCLSKDPDSRYKYCIDLLNDLASIDYSLDWLYTKDDITATEIWISDKDEKIIKLTKTSNGYEAIKTIKSSGNNQRITKYCKSNLSNSELAQFFKEV